MSKKRKTGKSSQIFMWLRRISLALCVVVATAWAGSWFFLSESDVRLANWAREQMLKITSDMGFVVEDLLVEGLENTDGATLKAVLNIQKGDPLFSLNPRDAKELIERISWVDTARVERRFPSTIYVHVQERKPLAFWQKDQQLKLLDQKGRVITGEALDRFKDLMIVIGEDAPEHAPDLVQALQGEVELMRRAKSATWVGGRRWNVVLEPGIEVKLPEGQTRQALAQLSEAQSKDKLLDKDITAIDLREQGRIVVSTKPGGVTEYKKGSQI